GYDKTGWGRCRGARAAGGRAVAAAVTLAVLLALAACSPSQPSVQLSPTSPHASGPSPAPSSPAASSPAAADRAAVVAASRALWPAGDRAERTGRKEQARAILAPYATPSYIRVLLAGMAPFWRRHEIARGYVINHIRSATVLTGQGNHLA